MPRNWSLRTICCCLVHFADTSICSTRILQSPGANTILNRFMWSMCVTNLYVLGSLVLNLIMNKNYESSVEQPVILTKWFEKICMCVYIVNEQIFSSYTSKMFVVVFFKSFRKELNLLYKNERCWLYWNSTKFVCWNVV